MSNSEEQTFEQVNDRLKEIVAQVEDESMPLDDALDLFEEAVKLGTRASTLLEEDIAARNAAEDAVDEVAAEQADQEQGPAADSSVVADASAADDAATASQL